MKRNLSRISLSTKNIDKTINSKDYFADDNDNIDIQNLRFNELRRECLKTLANQATVTSTAEYVRKCAFHHHNRRHNNSDNDSNNEKIKVTGGISGYWDSYTPINDSNVYKEPTTTTTTIKANDNARVMYIGGDKGIPIKINKVNNDSPSPRTPLVSIKKPNTYNINDQTPYYSNDDNHQPLRTTTTGYHSVFTKGIPNQSSSSSSSLLNTMFNDTLRAAITSRSSSSSSPFFKTIQPLKQNVENVNNINNQKYHYFDSNTTRFNSNTSIINDDDDDYRRFKNSDDNNYDSYRNSNERAINDNANVSPSFLQDAMSIGTTTLILHHHQRHHHHYHHLYHHP